MDEFQKECIERLTRLEVKISALQKSVSAFKTKVVVVASTLGAFVASVISALHSGR